MAKSTSGSSTKSSGGGGVGTRQHVKTPVRTGKPANGINPGGSFVSGKQVGQSLHGSWRLPFEVDTVEQQSPCVEQRSAWQPSCVECGKGRTRRWPRSSQL